MSDTKNPVNHTFLAWFLLIILSLIWGSSFILIKKSLIAFSPLQVGAARTSIAFLAFLPLFIKQYKQINWKKFFPLFIVGLCGSALPAFLYAIAQTRIPSGVAGILNALTPIFAFLLALLFFGKKFYWKHLIGISLGFIGCLLIFITKQDGISSFPLAFGFLIVLATFCYGVSVNTVGSYLKNTHPLIISTVSFTLVGPWVLIYLLNTDFIPIIYSHEYGLQSLLALTILSLVGTFGANIIFFKLIQITDPVFSSSVSFLTPIIALLWGFYDGEYMSFMYVAALVLIIMGVFLVKFSKEKVK